MNELIHNALNLGLAVVGAGFLLGVASGIVMYLWGTAVIKRGESER